MEATARWDYGAAKPYEEMSLEELVKQHELLLTLSTFTHVKKAQLAQSMCSGRKAEGETPGAKGTGSPG